jgi:hypothetical protein
MQACDHGVFAFSAETSEPSAASSNGLAQATAAELDSAIRPAQLPVRQGANASLQQSVFAGKQAGGECLRRVAGLNIDPGLCDHGSTVQFGRHEMHAGSMRAVACTQDALVCVQAGILGQQGRVDVDDAAEPGRDGGSGEDAHVSRQHDQVRLPRRYLRKRGAIEFRAIGKIPGIQSANRNAGGLGQGNGAAVGVVGKHADDLDRQFLASLCLDQRGQVAATAGGKNHDAHAELRALSGYGRGRQSRRPRLRRCSRPGGPASPVHPGWLRPGRGRRSGHNRCRN